MDKNNKSMEPQNQERPARYASRLGQLYCARCSPEKRKKNGQYFTPPEIADLMAAQINSGNACVSILDAGAGTGVLGCALCEHLANRKEKPSKIELAAYETDETLIELLERAFKYLKRYVKEKGISFEFQIKKEDFVLKYAHNLQETPSFPGQAKDDIKYDICISNPPYFKLSGTDPRAITASEVVYGQPNIYFLFMAVAAATLKIGGELVFITPRSFASGNYFKLFRKRFFKLVRPEFIHLFNSRKEAFKKYAVLQENIILKARRENNWRPDIKSKFVVISSSNGIADIELSRKRKIPLADIIDLSTDSKVLKIPEEDWEKVSVKFNLWNGSLAEYGLKISTGPVVAFRAKKFIFEKQTENAKCVPLLWLHNVKTMEIAWPLCKRGKPQYIRQYPESLPLLVPNGNYVLLRRFSAKEEARRLVAAPFIGKFYPYEMIGMENHINYIYRPKGTLREEEVWGLAVLYNSSFYDRYFRGLNGSTQVGATEVSSIPFPPMEIISEIGGKAISNANIKNEIDLLANLAFDETRRTKGILVNA
jgi:adenine-specific DNA-methyltransferase